MSSGIYPESKLSDISKNFSSLSKPRVDGIIPDMMFPFKRTKPAQQKIMNEKSIGLANVLYVMENCVIP